MKAIIRNSEGLVIATLGSPEPFQLDPFIVEALALFEAVKFCKVAALTHVMVEGDALRVVQLFKSPTGDLSHGGLIIQEAI